MKQTGKFIGYASILVLLLFVIQPFLLFAAEMENYCIVPPYVKRDVKPNILVIMDNAVVMGNTAYTADYDNTKTYAGLFKSNLKYNYGGGTWNPDATGVWSGNLLNWATTSKYDLLESILVGGKSTSRQTNVNTLLSVGNAWTKRLIYTDSLGASRTCLFIVSSANVEIKDETPGSCGYLDSPAHPLVASNESAAKFAEIASGDRQKESKIQNTVLDRLLRQSLWVLNAVMDFLVADAEAAPKLRLATNSVPDGKECTAYSATLSASGGTGTGYTWSITGLPAGLSVGAAGTPSTTITGTPTVASGNYPLSIQVCDSAGCITDHMDSDTFTLSITDATPTLTTSSPLQEGYVGSYYSVALNTFPCSSSSITLVSGSLPPNYFFAGNLIRGNELPLTAEGTYTFTVTVTDNKNNVSPSKTYTLKINPSLSGLSISSGSPLANGVVGTNYFIYVESAGGDPSCGGSGYVWSLDSGSLPPGLSLASSATTYYSWISGLPTTTGSYSFTIKVRDCLGGIATKTFSLTVDEAVIPIRTTGNRSVKIAAGTYTCNANTSPSCADAACAGVCSEIHCPGTCVLKSGIVDQFWPQARFGIEDFSKVSGAAIPNITNCIESNPGATPDENYLTALENAVPIDPITTLVNGAYSAIDYYANDTAANCDPFRGLGGSCPRSFNLFITSGVGADNPPTPSPGTPDVFTDTTNCGDADYENLSKNTCFGYSNDLRNNPIFGGSAIAGRQYVNTYIVNTMGTPTTMANGQCNPSGAQTTSGDILCQAANVGGGVYYEVVDPATLRDTLILAFQDIIKRAAAGTAASVLASGEGSGANLIQAVFYPRKKMNTAELAWIGRMSNFWFYVDPFFSASSIYEDNATSNYFNLSNDNKIAMYYDIANEKTMAHRYPPSGTLDDIEFESLNSLWEAGMKLWQRTTSRTIKTTLGSGMIDFSTTDATAISSISSFLDLPTTDSNGDGFADGDLNHDGSVTDTDANSDAGILIRYIGGEDFSSSPWLRSRTASIDVNNSGAIDAGETNVWKLGDILNSTPKIASWIALNNYDQLHKEEISYTAFLNSSNYSSRGMVFAGGNDGMLHAFKLGKMEVKWTGQGSTEKARMLGSDLGKEVWAYIPKNVLPYLKYLPRTDYCHVYSIDLSPYIFDASIGDTGCAEASYADCSKYATDGTPINPITNRWRTILIGGMRYGGACKNTCPDANCVQTPATDKGYSSYFALDITDSLQYPDDPGNHPPQLLWEFYDENLGFTTTGPAIIRIGADKNLNGKWFVAFGSGPTGPISTSDQQFLARSDQTMSLFILDLKTGTLLRTINSLSDGSEIYNAFAGSMLNATSDVDQDYQDDVVYIPYIKEDTATGTWTQGGVTRLQTKEDVNPLNWEWSTVYDNIGPVTASVTRLINKNKGQLWLFFGTGRYYFEQLTTVDDQDSRRALFGLKEPCYGAGGLDKDCTATFTGSLDDVTDTQITDPALIANGWRIDLDNSGNATYPEGNPSADVTRNYRAERVITDPLSTSSGLVFFTSYKPYNDVCAYGGKSFIWAVRYNTGSAPGALLKGIALLQVSTGSIEQINLADAFTEKGGRRSAALEGVPPLQQGLSLLTTPPPVKRTIHIRER